MMFVGLIAGYFTVFAAGMGVALLLMKGSRQLNVIECWCLSWLFGVGVVSLLLWLCGTVISGPVLQALITALCLVVAIAGWQIKQRRNVRFSLPRPQNALEWVLVSLLLVELVVIFLVCLKHTLGWDGLLNWEVKARYAFLNSGVLPGSYYSSSGRAFSHPEYPLAIPFTELWLYLWMGSPHQFWIKSIFPLFYIAGTLLLGLFVTRLSGKRWLGLLIALLFPFVPFITGSPGGVIVGYADVPLSVFYVTALGYLLCWLADKLPCSFVVYGAVLTLVPWVKSEGVILWSLLAVMGLFMGLYRHRIGLGALSILPGLFLIVGWRLYLTVMHAIMPSDFSRPTLRLLSDNLSRLTTICGIAFTEITDTSQWSIFWLIAFVAVIYLLVSRKALGLLLVTGVLGPVVIYLATYIFSAWPSYTAHVTSSLPRLLLQVVPAGWLAVGLVLSPLKAEPQTPHSELG